jgi:hypothetical protein
VIALDDIGERVRRGGAALRSTVTGRWRAVNGRYVPPAPAADPPGALGPPDLLLRRDQLARRLAELQWDLGGLTYEMAIRDHFRVDVLVRVAADLQVVDGELAEIERLLRLAQAGAAGACPSCGALHARGAGFCWQCGTTLLAAHSASPG